MPYTLMATVDGVQKEVVVNEIPDAVVADIAKQRKLMSQEVFESEMERRTNGIIKNKGYRLPNELLDDATFVEQVSTKHKLKKADATQDDATVAQQLQQRLETERKSWEDKILSPTQLALKTANERVTSLTQSGLRKEILRAAGIAGLKKQYLREPVPGKAPLAVGIFDGLFRHDLSTDSYYVAKGDDAFEFSSKPTKERPYMSVEEYIGSWAEQKENADFIDTQHQGGPGLGTRSDTAKAAAGSITLTPDQAGDHGTYQKALEAVKGDHSKINIQGLNGTSPFGTFPTA